MGAPKGNSFWKARSKHGRDKLFETPELLLKSAEEYFDWCDENPWITSETTQSTKDESVKEKPTQRPYSKSGWYHYIGASENWLSEFKKSANKDFLGVIEQIENFIATQQWEGATVGAFNANIIARTLGLTDKAELKANFEDMPVSLSSEALSKLIDKL